MKTKELIKQILLEETKVPAFVRRRFQAEEEYIEDQLKREVLKNIRRSKNKDKDIEQILVKSAMDAAYEFLDPIDEWRDLPQKESVIILKDVSSYIYDQYKNKVREFIQNMFDEKNDVEDGFVYTFWKHSERNGGNGFADSFKTWNELLMEFGSWFADLNWNEIKSKLDKTDGKTSILIKKPGDRFNIYNYYFSILKNPQRR